MDLSKFLLIELANEISEKIWNEVVQWSQFKKDTIGKQLVRAADSISANLSEAYGRFSYLDRKRFCYYARGSLCETINWISKASKRNFIEKERTTELLDELTNISFKLNYYIKSLTKSQSNSSNTPNSTNSTNSIN